MRVIIAAAGGAAHLAGVVAAHTVLPVIGIPVATDLAGGLDSLLSMVQMPGDVPVATSAWAAAARAMPASWRCRCSPWPIRHCKRNTSLTSEALVEKVLAKGRGLAGYAEVMTKTETCTGSAGRTAICG